MSGRLLLNGAWGLTYAEGPGLMNPSHYTAVHLRGRKLMPARVPAPIHQVLMEHGLLEDPNVGLNSLKARWVEEQFWIYRQTIDVPDEAVRHTASLVFEKLEYDARVWLNGELVGTHANAHRPARFDVRKHLRPGQNLLVVQLSTGVHSAVGKPTSEYSDHPLDQLTNRPWLRNPQYQGGWDWNARLTNVGILGDVALEWHAGPRLDQAAVFAMVSEDLAKATLHARAFIEQVAETAVKGTLRAKVLETGDETEIPLTVEPGNSEHELTLEIDKPRLWWPVGQGEPFMHTVELTFETGGETQTLTRRTGFRRVEIDQSPHPVEGRYCILKINNRPVFCKGGNWVPPDLLYSTPDRERYDRLVQLAVDANANTLRVWGGGCFPGHDFYASCDEAGVLIWHDFLFACAKYPGDHPDFAAEVRRETTWATRQFAHHPSIIVWCGNNEIEWGDWAWGYDDRLRTHPHYALFHHDMPKIATRENPHVPYWISSPYSPDFAHPNDPTVGDQHPWGVSILDPGGADFWTYRSYVDRFPNEGGVIGASSPATLRQCMPGDQCRLLSPTWDHHDNPFATNAPTPGDLGRAYATVELWTGRNPEQMDWEEYAFTSALLQAEGLTEYITNYRRRMFSSASAIFWMYNDSWPVTHGWTIVDYYLRRKLAYCPVQRAFAPVTVVVAEEDEDEEVAVFGVNDSTEAFSGEVRYGLFALAGGLPMDESKKVTLEPNTSTELARFSIADWDKLGVEKSGAFAVLSRGGQTVAQHRLLRARFKHLAFAPAKIDLKLEQGRLTCSSDVFAWGVCLDVDGEKPLPDNAFDLLPGIPYTFDWPAELGTPEVVRLGSRDAVKVG